MRRLFSTGPASRSGLYSRPSTGARALQRWFLPRTIRMQRRSPSRTGLDRCRPRGVGAVRSRGCAAHRCWGGRSEVGETSYVGLAESDPPRKPAVIGEHSTCLMLYTSGTTWAAQRCAAARHRNELSAAVSQIAHNRYLFGESGARGHAALPHDGHAGRCRRRRPCSTASSCACRHTTPSRCWA